MQTGGDPTLERLDALVGQWTMEARPPAGSPWAGGRGHVGFEWLDGERFLVQRWTIEAPEAPDGIAIIGAGDEPGSLRQHYFDSRGVHRLFDMTFADGVWTLDREAVGPKDFDQRMKATFSADGNTITAEFELRDSRTHEMRPDFSLTYRRS